MSFSATFKPEKPFVKTICDTMSKSERSQKSLRKHHEESAPVKVGCQKEIVQQRKCYGFRGNTNVFLEKKNKLLNLIKFDKAIVEATGSARPSVAQQWVNYIDLKFGSRVCLRELKVSLVPLELELAKNPSYLESLGIRKVTGENLINEASEIDYINGKLSEKSLNNHGELEKACSKELGTDDDYEKKEFESEMKDLKDPMNVEPKEILAENPEGAHSLDATNFEESEMVNIEDPLMAIPQKNQVEENLGESSFDKAHCLEAEESEIVAAKDQLMPKSNDLAEILEETSTLESKSEAKNEGHSLLLNEATEASSKNQEPIEGFEASPMSQSEGTFITGNFETCEPESLQKRTLTDESLCDKATKSIDMELKTPCTSDPVAINITKTDIVSSNMVKVELYLSFNGSLSENTPGREHLKQQVIVKKPSKPKRIVKRRLSHGFYIKRNLLKKKKLRHRKLKIKLTTQHGDPKGLNRKSVFHDCSPNLLIDETDHHEVQKSLEEEVACDRPYQTEEDISENLKQHNHSTSKEKVDEEVESNRFDQTEENFSPELPFKELAPGYRIVIPIDEDCSSFELRKNLPEIKKEKAGLSEHFKTDQAHSENQNQQNHSTTKEADLDEVGSDRFDQREEDISPELPMMTLVPRHRIIFPIDEDCSSFELRKNLPEMNSEKVASSKHFVTDQTHSEKENQENHSTTKEEPDVEEVGSDRLDQREEDISSELPMENKEEFCLAIQQNSSKTDNNLAVDESSPLPSRTIDELSPCKSNENQEEKLVETFDSSLLDKNYTSLSPAIGSNKELPSQELINLEAVKEDLEMKEKDIENPEVHEVVETFNSESLDKNEISLSPGFESNKELPLQESTNLESEKEDLDKYDRKAENGEILEIVEDQSIAEPTELLKMSSPFDEILDDPLVDLETSHPFTSIKKRKATSTEFDESESPLKLPRISEKKEDPLEQKSKPNNLPVDLGEVDSSPENQILGNISPSTPQRKETNSSFTKDGEVSDDALQLQGDISPLTPVAVDKSSSSLSDYSDDVDSTPPKTPPLPPPPSYKSEDDQKNAQSSDDQVDEMSPVSDVELEEVSPPVDSPTTPEECNFPSPPAQRTPAPPSEGFATPPPLPPSPPPPSPPMEISMTPPPPPKSVSPRPESLLTSPIGSSSDEMDSNCRHRHKLKKDMASSTSASDISDTDFACQSESEKVSREEVDLEELEQTRAELKARLQAAHLEGSYKVEVQSEEDHGSSTPACKSDAQIKKELLSISPKSDCYNSEVEKDSDQRGKSKHDHTKHLGNHPCIKIRRSLREDKPSTEINVFDWDSPLLRKKRKLQSSTSKPVDGKSKEKRRNVSSTDNRSCQPSDFSSLPQRVTVDDSQEDCSTNKEVDHEEPFDTSRQSTPNFFAKRHTEEEISMEENEEAPILEDPCEMEPEALVTHPEIEFSDSNTDQNSFAVPCVIQNYFVREMPDCNCNQDVERMFPHFLNSRDSFRTFCLNCVVFRESFRINDFEVYSDDLTYKCSVCSFETKKLAFIRDHVALSHAQYVFHCPSCEFQAEFDHLLKNHWDQTHGMNLL